MYVNDVLALKFAVKFYSKCLAVSNIQIKNSQFL